MTERLRLRGTEPLGNGDAGTYRDDVRTLNIPPKPSLHLPGSAGSFLAAGFHLPRAGQEVLGGLRPQQQPSINSCRSWGTDPSAPSHSQGGV